MSSEEWIVHTKLVEHHPEILNWLSVEPWNVRASEWVASVTELKNHGERSLKLLEDSSIVTSPVSSELLRSEEEASCENERSSLRVVSLDESSEG